MYRDLTISQPASPAETHQGVSSHGKHTNPDSSPGASPLPQQGLVIGITGGTGCGKTTLLKVIAQAGGVILDCDAIYHELLRTDASLLTAIEARFPGVVEDGQLQRKNLGAIVFADPAALHDLNTITHSAVKTVVMQELAKKPPLAAIDAIALFEGELADLCHVTVAVTAPREDRVARLMERDGITREYAHSRIAAQHDEDWFRQRCHRILENNGTKKQFQEKCVAFLRTFGIIDG